ncbi:grass carp reovirus (GCRV)-induced gene 2e [Centroberyx affinis]|uniref:grass carp reovirus (GCRV)-induced gene 2e n=1 Tax=Centroberyx affinis TaxID=166261 RepID=UPI003A5BD376
MSRYQWAEDFDPPGVGRLIGNSAPTSGKVYIMYHGTSKHNARLIQRCGFKRSADGMLGPGVYLSRDLEKASRYPTKVDESERVVIKVIVNVGNVIAINRQRHPRQKTWHDYRYGEVYDTAWVPPNCGMVPSGLEENCVWDPDQITILSVISPRKRSPTYYASGYMKTCTNTDDMNAEYGQKAPDADKSMSRGRDQQFRYQWAEEDFDPPGVGRLVGHSAPTSGKVYIMYHGTSKHSAALIQGCGFKQSAVGMLGPGVYLSRDLDKASRYPLELDESERVVIKVKVNVGKVIAINRQGHPRQKTWHDPKHGEVYDTAWVPPNCGMVKSGLEENCVWDPDRITVLKFYAPKLWNSLPKEPISGYVYIMYHGTSRENAELIQMYGFKQSKDGMLGPGVYLSRDLQKASRYPLELPESERVVVMVQVYLGKVIAINRQHHPRQKTWHDYRYGEVYDTAWVPPNCGMVKSGLEENCVWDPKRIMVLNVISPRLLPCSMSRYEWAEEDFDPPGVGRLVGLSTPTSGKVYIMYHGTSKHSAALIQAHGFKRSADGMLGPGVYLSRDLDKASRYPLELDESKRVVIKVKVNVGKVITINRQGHPRQQTWHDYRYGEVYDTAWVPPNCGMVKSGLEENCVWDPDRITVLKVISPRQLPPTSGYACGYSS